MENGKAVEVKVQVIKHAQAFATEYLAKDQGRAKKILALAAVCENDKDVMDALGIFSAALQKTGMASWQVRVSEAGSVLRAYMIDKGVKLLPGIGYHALVEVARNVNVQAKVAVQAKGNATVITMNAPTEAKPKAGRKPRVTDGKLETVSEVIKLADAQQANQIATELVEEGLARENGERTTLQRIYMMLDAVNSATKDKAIFEATQKAMADLGKILDHQDVKEAA